MSVSISVTVDTRELERIANQLEVKKHEVGRMIGPKAESYAKGFAPVDTGWLRSSLQSFMVGKAVARIQSDANYDIYQELGTYKMAAHPFLTPSIEQIAGRFLSPATWSPLIYE